MGARSTKALDRYLRLRRAHHDTHTRWLWLSRQGRFTENGIGQMVARRGRSVGMKVHPHQLRHSWAHAAQVKGMGANDLKMAGQLAIEGDGRTLRSQYRHGALARRAEAAQSR